MRRSISHSSGPLRITRRGNAVWRTLNALIPIIIGAPADEKTRRFIAAHRRAFGAEPVASAALSYDAVSLVAEAIRAQGRADAESIRSGLASLGPFDGVSGTIDFRGSNDPVRSVFIRKIIPTLRGRWSDSLESPSGSATSRLRTSDSLVR